MAQPIWAATSWCDRHISRSRGVFGCTVVVLPMWRVLGCTWAGPKQKQYIEAQKCSSHCHLHLDGLVGCVALHFEILVFEAIDALGVTVDDQLWERFRFALELRP